MNSTVSVNNYPPSTDKGKIKPAYCKLRTRCTLRHICNSIYLSQSKDIPQNRSYLRGEVVDRGKTGFVMVIKDGVAVSFFNQVNGERFINSVLTPGCTIGETGVFIDADAVDFILPASDLEVCAIPKKAFLSTIANNATLLKDIVNASTNYTAAVSYQTWILQGTRVADRIERFVAMCLARLSTELSDNLYIPISHDTLALIVHAERSSTSRALEKMESEELVTLRTNSIVVHVKKWMRSPRFKRQMQTATETVAKRFLELL